MNSYFLTKEDKQLINKTLANSAFIDQQESAICKQALTTNNQNDNISLYQKRPLVPERKDMPYLNFGEKFSTGRSQFLKLKANGEKVRVRLLGAPFVEGKHFDQNPDDSWTVTNCARINNKETCELCEKYFAVLRKAQKTGDETVIKEAKKEARKYQASVSFCFPVLNRDTGEFVVFQSKMSVKNQIEEELAAGTKIFESDFVVMRTETNGAVRYPVKKVDSADTPPLNKEELEEIEKYKKINLEEIINGQKDEEGDIATEENVLVLNTETGEVTEKAVSTIKK